MDHEMKTNYHETKSNHRFATTTSATNATTRKLPKGERRVRFADTMGMELVSIFLIDLIVSRTIGRLTSSYYTASSTDYNQHHQYGSADRAAAAREKKSNYVAEPKAAVRETTGADFIFTCDFTQPISLISFKERVRMNKVHLETCQVNSTAGQMSVSCTIRVLNLAYEKSLIVRYTTDEWRTSADSLASYRPGSCDGWSDKFTSTFSLIQQVKSFKDGQRILFAIGYRYGPADQHYHWDNNGGLNYSISITRRAPYN